MGRKPQRKRLLRRQRRRWLDNVKLDLGEMDLGGVGWISLDQDSGKWRTLVNAVMNFRIP
jgi:hypothetical protein